MKNFLEKNKVYIDFIYKILNLLLKIGIAGLLAVTFKLFDVTNTFITNNIGLILLFIIICVIIALWDLKSIKNKLNSLILDEIVVISDEETHFNGSKKYPTIPSAKAVATIVHPAWLFDRQFYNEFKNSKWIAHTEKITNDEAIFGGDYEFNKKFNIPFDIKKIKSATIHIIVDDYFILILNDKKISEKTTGNSLLHSFDVKREIIKGENQIRLNIENASFEDFVKKNPSHELALSQEKYRYNPYGVRFCLEIKYIK